MLSEEDKIFFFLTSKNPHVSIALTTIPLCIHRPTCTTPHFLFIHPCALLLQAISLGLAQGSTDII